MNYLACFFLSVFLAKILKTMTHSDEIRQNIYVTNEVDDGSGNHIFRMVGALLVEWVKFGLF